jgi:hypothetical protein
MIKPMFRLCGLCVTLLAGCTGTDTAAGSTTSGSASTSSGGDTPTGDMPTATGEHSSSSTGEGTSTGTSGGSTTCGDGVVDPGEGCDDGPDNEIYAACTDTCQPNVCGDHKVHVGVEACDEGAGNVDTGYCRSDCQLGVCGDGYLFAALEECDAGEANGPNYGGCDDSCKINRCGDGEIDVGFEECDAGADNGTRRPDETGMASCDLDCGFAGRRIFLSSQLFTGDMGTRAGADLACQVMAEAAGFRHSERYRALLADANGAPNDYVDAEPPDDDSLPFILPTGLVLAASFPSLLELGPGAGVTITETGEMLFAQRVWTNVNPAGDAYLEDPASTCADWSSADILKTARVGYNAVAPGDAAALAEWQAKKQWLSFSNELCPKTYRIYCIETR